MDKSRQIVVKSSWPMYHNRALQEHVQAVRGCMKHTTQFVSYVERDVVESLAM